MEQPPAATGAADRPRRRRFAVDGRTRSGCSTCKARKKKCDGQLSSLDGRCGSCVRLGLVCEQVPLRTVQPPPARRKGKAGGDLDAYSPQASSNNADKGSESQSSVSPPEQNDAERHYGGAGQGSGLLVNASTDFPPMTASLDDAERRFLIKYFLDHVAPLCSILQQDGAIFSSVLLPMAIVDPPLLYALFAYASVHSNAATAKDPDTTDSRLEYENRVARGVAEAIKRNAVTETTVACALVISTTEVVAGDTSRWLLHLQGAGHLVNHLGSSRLLRTTDGKFLLRYFAYHDIMASLSTGRRTLMEGVYWVEEVEATIESADSFMGLAHHIFRHLPDISAFVEDTADLTASSCADRRAREAMRAEDMAQVLRSQDLRIQVDQEDLHNKALIHHAEAFRFASLLYIYRHLLRFCDPGAVYKLRISDCVRHILQHARQVPSNLFCEMGLLFPLFMAGIVSGGDIEAREYVQDRLMGIEDWTKFKHVKRVRELLQMLWSRDRMDWEIMLVELDWKLSLA